MSLERWGWYSAGVNVVLAMAHGIIALISGSLAVTAELVHNAADLLTAIAVIVGLRLATRKSDAFPYGLYKVENLAAIALALVIFLTAYEIAREALFTSRSPVDVAPWMFPVIAATLAIPLVFSHFELRTARMADSPSLMADAREYRIHALTTGLVLLALVSDWIGWPIDRVAAVLIVVAAVKTGWDLLRDSMRVLLDASLDNETLRSIHERIEREPAVAEVTWVTGRNAGQFRFVEAGVALRTSQLEKAPAAVQRIEADIRAAMPRIERALIHVEPRPSLYIRYALPLADTTGKLSEHFGQAPYFALVDVRRENGSVGEQRVVTNPHQSVAKGKGIRVAEWLVGQKVDAVLVKEDLHAKGPAYVFGDAGIDVFRTDKSLLAEALASANS